MGATRPVFRRRRDRILQVEDHRVRAHVRGPVKVTGLVAGVNSMLRGTGFMVVFIPFSIRSAR